MSNDNDEVFVSDPVDLTPQVYVDGSDYQLLCCAGHSARGGASGSYLTAAALVYELTGQPGKVVRDIITFEYDQVTIEIDVLGGQFRVKQDDEVVHSGRKAFELLMRVENKTFEQALEWIAEKFSAETASLLAQDYVKIRLAARTER